MKIKFVDLGRQFEEMENELMKAIAKTLEGQHFILGKEVIEFEKMFKNYIGCNYSVGVDSGTSALHLALKTIGIQPGDEVITVPNTFISTAFAISECGANIVFVDVDDKTQLMDLNKIKNVISKKVKAIIPVHLFGQMVDMNALMNIAKNNNIFVIEDACQAHGASQNGRMAGSIGDLACFSFYPGKNLGAYGDAGMVTTNNKSYFEKLILLRNYGSSKKYFHNCRGYNARLDTIQASILKEKLKYLNSWNIKRREIAQIYLQNLNGVGDIILPTFKEGYKSSYHLFVIRSKQRNELYNYLNSMGIQTIIHYPIPIHLQKAYVELKLEKGSFPISEMLADEILSIPLHPNLTKKEIYYVITCIKDFFDS